jgi:hypothetical protein
MTERDGFLERRAKLVAARCRLNKEDPRYPKAVENAFSLLDSPDLASL